MAQHSPLPAQAIVLAAGRGERMRPLTDHSPKPLLPVQGKPLLAWHLAALAHSGVRQAVINTAWLEEQIPDYFGDQTEGMALRYSLEGRDFGGALETAGGIARALPGLADVFWVVAGDVYTPDFPFDPAALQRLAASPLLAHLWLVPNPAHHPQGDFGLSAQGLALNLPAEHPGPRHTYSTIGVYKRAFFEAPLCDIPAGNPQGVKAALGPLLRRAMDQGLVSAELYSGRWTDVGTPERLAQLNSPQPETA
ncbi:MAG TPA: nucleotidyltransferase family protein [Macromonas sp.]|nr:nucleotidyltransferase family protein [Macromonas sp.]